MTSPILVDALRMPRDLGVLPIDNVDRWLSDSFVMSASKLANASANENVSVTVPDDECWDIMVARITSTANANLTIRLIPKVRRTDIVPTNWAPSANNPFLANVSANTGLTFLASRPTIARPGDTVVFEWAGLSGLGTETLEIRIQADRRRIPA